MKGMVRAAPAFWWLFFFLGVVVAFPIQQLPPPQCLHASNPSESLRTFIERQDDIADIELKQTVIGISEACIQFFRQLGTLPFEGKDFEAAGNINVQEETQKVTDVVDNDIMMQKLRPIVAALASEDEEEFVRGGGSELEVAFDPLDGSSNLDVNLPTGTIFGIAPHPHEDQGRSLVAARYALYSASTELILVIQTQKVPLAIGFALNDGVFCLARSDITCPPWGPFYSLNEAREPDWPNGLRRWIQDAKHGRLDYSKGTKYSSRYVCGLCADVHRALLKGGWVGNPRPHLRLLYEAAPMAFICEAVRGKGSDGVRNILDIVPGRLHERTCVFLGSRLDIEGLEMYGDVTAKLQELYHMKQSLL